MTEFRMILGLEQDSISTNNSQPTISTIQNEQCYPRVEQGSQTTTENTALQLPTPDIVVPAYGVGSWRAVFSRLLTDSNCYSMTNRTDC